MIQNDFRMKISNKRDRGIFWDFGRDTCTLIVSLTQSLDDRKSSVSIGFKIYKVPETNDDQEPEDFMKESNLVDKTPKWRNTREVLKIKLYYVSIFSISHVTGDSDPKCSSW